MMKSLRWWLRGKGFACQCRRRRFDLWVRKIPWRRKWQPTPVFLPEKSHGQRNLVGYHPKGGKESDTAEHARWLCHSFIPVLSSGMGRQRCAQQDREDEGFHLGPYPHCGLPVELPRMPHKPSAPVPCWKWDSDVSSEYA